MDYNATTPLALEVIQTVTEAMQEAWGNPSSTYKAGRSSSWEEQRAGSSGKGDRFGLTGSLLLDMHSSFHELETILERLKD